MKSDIERHRARLRRHERTLWWRDLSYSVKITWPVGVLGTLYGVLLLLVPVWILFAAAFLGQWMQRRSDADRP